MQKLSFVHTVAVNPYLGLTHEHTLPSYKRSHYYISYLKERAFSTQLVAFDVVLDEKDRDNYLEIQTIEKLLLDPTTHYHYGYQKVALTHMRHEMYMAYVINQKAYEHEEKQIDAGIKHIDMLVPEALLYHAFYDENVPKGMIYLSP